MCRVVSSELNDPELERKIIALVKLFHFDPQGRRDDHHHQTHRLLPGIA